MSRQTHVAVSDLKARLSAWIRRVGRGEQIVVTDRGRPVARLSALTDDEADGLDDLAAQGLLTRGRGAGLAPHVPGEVRGGALSDTVIDDRSDRL